MFKKIDAMYMKVTLMMTMMLMSASPALAAAIDDGDLIGSGLDTSNAVNGSVDWPWTRFLNSLAREMTGPLPMILGILGIAIAAIALLQGNGGAGTQKAFMLIMAVSVAMFTPTLIQYISNSASGATIDAVVSVSAVAGTVAPPLLP